MDNGFKNPEVTFDFYLAKMFSALGIALGVFCECRQIGLALFQSFLDKSSDWAYIHWLPPDPTVQTLNF